MIIMGLVAVRMKSSRLKQKALVDLNGKPLILRLLERVRQSKKLTDVVLCTSTHPEDAVLDKLGRENGYKTFCGSEDDVMKRFLDCIKNQNADIAVRITGDNPLTDPENIDRMIESHIATKSDYTRTDDLPYGITAEVISVPALKKAFELAEDSSHSEYMTWYFTKNDFFKLNILKAPSDVSRPDYRLTVDFQEDIDVLNRIYKEFDFDKKQPRLPEIISFLDKHPEIISLNKKVPEFKAPANINTRLKK